MSQSEMMEPRSCSCLNVRVGLKTEATPDEVITRDEKDSFFMQDLVQGSVDFGGIKVEHVYLLQSRTVGVWLVTRCINCLTDTHAMHKEKGSGCVLVSKHLLSDSSAMSSVQSSPAFSPVFQIALGGNPASATATHATDQGSQPNRRSASTEAAFVAIQSRMSQFLREEEERMEERIRAFTEQQHQDFLNMQDKARTDRQKMLNILTHLESQNVHPSIVASKSGLDAAIPPRQVSTSSGPRRKVAEVAKATPPKGVGGMAGGKGGVGMGTGGGASGTTYSLDMHTVFDMEGMEPDQGQGDCPSEDEPDTDDSGSHDEGIHIPRSRQSKADLARSLPVSVPAYTQTRHTTYDSDDERTHHEPSDIAESIKALAQSVHGDSDLFGDLPRPRFNTHQQ